MYDASQSYITATPNLTETRPDTRAPSWEPAEEHCAIHPVLLLTQRLHGDLSRERRGQVDAHQIHIRMQQHVIDPVSVEGHVHVARQLLRLLLRAAPQRLHREALVLQQRDDDPGRQTGAEHTHTGQHDCRAARGCSHTGGGWPGGCEPWCVNYDHCAFGFLPAV